jgi:GDP-L-fucose synthase
MITYVAGHTGMVGSALMRQFTERGIPVFGHERKYLDLTDQRAVFNFLQAAKPDRVIIAAALVGGIHANDTYPADFIRDNLAITTNLIEGSRRAGVKRLLFLGSSCIYPKDAPQPIKEESLLTGPLEPTNEAYAIAKIAGVKMCQYYRKQYGLCYHSVMPCNLYGLGDKYHPNNSHVIPALINRFHAAKMRSASSVTIWGTGEPLREFLYVDDLASACITLLDEKEPPDVVNVGSGDEITIMELAQLIGDVVGFNGDIELDRSKPDGTMRKLLDSNSIQYTGWIPKTTLTEGLMWTYQDYLKTL